MYQKCPKCNGEGFIETIPLGSSIMMNKETCPVCKGECIIHQESGLPPSLHNIRIKGTPPNFLDGYIEKREEGKEEIFLGFKCPWVKRECPYIDSSGMTKTQACDHCDYPNKIWNEEIGAKLDITEDKLKEVMSESFESYLAGVAFRIK